jgi:signal transduction histidine kinase
LRAFPFPASRYGAAAPRRRWATATGLLIGVAASLTLDGAQWSWRPLVVVAASVLLAVAIVRLVRRAAVSAAEDAARRAQRELLAGMQHELRTPLNSVIGFSNVLLRNERGALGPKELQYLERVRANGELLLGVVEAMCERAEGTSREPRQTASDRAPARTGAERAS